MNVTSLLILFSAFSILNGTQSTVEHASVKEYGIYESRDSKSYDDPSSPSGKVHYDGQPFLKEETSQIPATLGISFGATFDLKLSSENPTSIRAVYSFPEIHNPKEEAGYTRYDQEIYISPEYTDYTMLWMFEEPWELVPGEWSFSIHQGTNMLAEQIFTIVKPE